MLSQLDISIHHTQEGHIIWMFSTSVDGANASANLYSLAETAKTNGLKPYAYLKKVLTDLPAAKNGGRH